MTCRIFKAVKPQTQINNDFIRKLTTKNWQEKQKKKPSTPTTAKKLKQTNKKQASQKKTTTKKHDKNKDKNVSNMAESYKNHYSQDNLLESDLHSIYIDIFAI